MSTKRSARSSSLQGLGQAISGVGSEHRLDPQTFAEANGETDERFRGISNMGPEFDAAFGSLPNPGGRPDSQAFGPRYSGAATHQAMPFKSGDTEDMALSPEWWASIDGPYAPTNDSLPPSLRGLARSA